MLRRCPAVITAYCYKILINNMLNNATAKLLHNERQVSFIC